MLAIKSELPVNSDMYFLALKRMAEKGMKSPHGDGFGFLYSTESEYGVFKSLDQIWNYAHPFMEMKLGIFHARKASSGYTANLHHVHPFITEVQGKTWVFAHNGTIYDVNIDGVIDSQYYFSKIQEKLLKWPPEDALLATAKEIEKEKKFTSLTCILSDLEDIWAMKYYSDPGDNYHNLYYMEHNGVKVLASEPITQYIDVEGIVDFRELGNCEIIKL
ncbi:class II glutamine amidotransferase [Kosmotoga pacifica]|uniref:class II glutamine amidotransferase n=1 Tax=Kosmotoga pacifica TaxID=1330330 RepID=UPI001FDF1B66|nr:class II glutamine amidotransferase [Kosmotoga pacifica]